LTGVKVSTTYWSSTTMVSFVPGAATADFENGTVTFNRLKESVGNAAWPVRGGRR
jgi:hypothetical protein